MDETYVGGKLRDGRHGGRANKTSVVSLVERGGNVRSMVMERITSRNLRSAIREHVEVGSTVCTDDFSAYRGMPKIFTHKAVKHSAYEYARREGDFTVHTNTVEGSFSLLKRGIIGTFHQISKKYLPLYLAEFDHRYNHRATTDGERTVAALRLAEGKRLTLKPMKKGVEKKIQYRPKILQFTKRNTSTHHD